MKAVCLNSFRNLQQIKINLFSTNHFWLFQAPKKYCSAFLIRKKLNKLNFF